MNTRNLLRIAGTALAAAMLWACTTTTDRPAGATTRPATSPSADVVHVSIDNFSFHPGVVTVPAGARVVWVNRDDVPHTVTATGKEFTSAALDTDEQYSRVFPAAGQYDYYCAVHPHMTGKVIVK
jgi:plastocyanin